MAEAPTILVLTATKRETGGMTEKIDNLSRDMFPSLNLHSIEDVAWIQRVCSFSAFFLLIDTPRRDATDVSDKDLAQCYQILTNECIRRRKRVVQVLVDSTNSGFNYDDWKMTRRIRKLFIFYYLTDKTMDKLALKLKTSEESDSFSSPGESFAWQLVEGFLCYVLPNLKSQVDATLLDEDGSLRVDVLKDCGVKLADPKRVLVLPQYFLLLREQVVCNQVSVDMTPLELFPGCRKIGKPPSQLCLEFDSPGYKKKTPAYLLELKEPITYSNGANSCTHVILFIGYAAPMFVMQNLDISDEDKISMLKDFTSELEVILGHPMASQMLQKFSGIHETRADFQTPTLQLLEVSDEISLESDIVQRTKDYLRSIDEATQLIKEFGQTSLKPTDEFPEDTFPLMSMAFAMAANSFVGFGMILKNYLESLISSAQNLPFDLPYCFVFPRSNQYPDEKKLEQLFDSVGVQSEQQNFQVVSGRRYTYRVHTWRNRRIAFEVPPSVLNIRKQAEISVGGIGSDHLRAHLDEFKSELNKFIANCRSSSSELSGCFKVVEWDDVSGFRDDEGSTDPSEESAIRLLDCVFQAGA